MECRFKPAESSNDFSCFVAKFQKEQLLTMALSGGAFFAPQTKGIHMVRKCLQHRYFSRSHKTGCRRSSFLECRLLARDLPRFRKVGGSFAACWR